MRIKPVDRNIDVVNVRRNFDAVEKRLGTVPNMMRTMAQSPSAFAGYLALSGSLGSGVLPAGQQEQIALAVAEANECDYCLSAHTALGRAAGLSDDQLDASREGRDPDPRVQAALQFALAILQSRGAVSDDDLARIRAAGYSDGEIAEIVAHVALNIFTNYFNRLAETEIDFPRVSAGQYA